MAQNANLFTINLLFWQVRALQFVLIVIAVSIGFIIGYITSEILKGKEVIKYNIFIKYNPYLPKIRWSTRRKNGFLGLVS